MTRAELIAEAERWLDPVTRWVHQASCRGVGADCIGFIAGVAAACGSAEAQRFLATPAWRSYGRHPAPEFLFTVCDELMDRTPVSAAEPGDVLVFNCGRHPMHFALLAAAGQMIHAWLGARRVCRHRLDAEWRSRLVRAYRIRGVA